MNKKERYKLTRERNESGMDCEKIIDTKPFNKNDYQPLVLDIKFYLVDDDGNSLNNKDGTTKEFRIKDGVRFKPLEYLCEDFDINILKEIKNGEKNV